MPRDERDAALQEAKLLADLRHPNIVACVESFVDKKSKKLCIVQEYCAGGDVHQRLRDTKARYRRGMLKQGYAQTSVTKSLPSGLTESTAVDWFTEILLGMKHVHDRKVLHRDLKTQNVFLTADGRCRLGDFGVSKVLSGTHHLASTAVGTPYYLSPEICENREYDHKSDVWSLGCVLYELCSGAHPFDAASLKLLVAKITKGTYAQIPGCGPEINAAIKAMLQRDAAKRPSVNELLARPPFARRAEALLDKAVFAEEFSHTVLHGVKNAKNANDVLKNRNRISAPGTPPERSVRSLEEARERVAPLAPLAPLARRDVPSRRVPSPPRAGPQGTPAEPKKEDAPPQLPRIPRVVATRKKTAGDESAGIYPRAAPLPFRRAPTRDVRGEAGAGGDLRARAELARREREAQREREARERRHRERAARASEAEAESRVAEQRLRARREFKERQAALRAARRDAAAGAAAGAAACARGVSGVESRRRSALAGDPLPGFAAASAFPAGDAGVAVYVPGGRVASAKEKRSSRERSPPPLPLHDPAAQRRRAHSPTEGRVDAFAAARDGERPLVSAPMEVEPLAARQAQSARALAYWESRAEADRNRRRCGTPATATEPDADADVPVRAMQPNVRASVEVLKPGDAAYGAVLGVDTAPPDSDAAAALVACGRIVRNAAPGPVDAPKEELLSIMAEEKEKDPASDALRRAFGSETRDATSAHIPSGASLPLRVAALRAQLRAELGVEKFDAAYQSLDSMDESVDAAHEAGVLVKRLGSDVAALGRVHRLLVWEDAMRERERQRERRARRR